MKYFVSSFIFFALICSGSMIAQKPSPVAWNFELKKLDVQNLELIATATMQKSWVIYSQLTDDNGPIPTSFVVNDQDIKFDEKSKALKEFDNMFEVNVIKFKDKAVFSTKIPINKGKSVKGYVTYMTCDGSKCLPPTDVEFDLKF